MRVVTRLCATGVLCLWGTAVSSAQDGDTVKDFETLTELEAVERFMTNDPRVRALETRVDEIRAEQADRARWSNPVVFYSQETTGDVQDAFLLARQELPVTGRLGLFREAGRIAVETTQADVWFQIAQLRAEVRYAFTDLVLAQEREATLQQGLIKLQDVVRILHLREEAGEGSTFHRMRVERELVDWEAEMGSARVARAEAQGRLVPYLGPDVVPVSLVASGRLDPGARLPPLAMLVEQALSNRLDYRSTALSIAQFDAERRAAERRRLPTPLISGGSKRSSVGETTKAGYVFSVDLAIPLFDRGQSAAAVARAQMTRAEAEAASLRLRIEADVRTAHAALVLRDEQADRYRQSVAETAEPLAEIGRIGYQEGELSILELLDAERQALEARLAALDLSALARRAAIELDRIVGAEVRP